MLSNYFIYSVIYKVYFMIKKIDKAVIIIKWVNVNHTFRRLKNAQENGLTMFP